MSKKTKLITKIVATILILFTVSIAVIFIRIRIKQNNSVYTSSRVTIGSVYTSIDASGEAVAENEVLILCPHGSIVHEVYRLPGSKVSKNEVILTLDQSSLLQDLDDVKDQLEILNINLRKIQLAANTTKIDLDHDLEVKRLKIASLKAELEDQIKLIDVGGISQARVDKTKQELVLAEKDLLRSSEKHKLKLEQLKIDEKGIAFQISMKEKQISTKQALVSKMVVKSPGTGIILEVRARKGESKNKNELLVRISEHTRLKINGEIEERKSKFLRNGGKVFAEIEGLEIPGVIGNIRPELKDNKIQFDVFLENPHTEELRINQKVELHIVKEIREDVLRVEKGQYFSNERHVCNVIEEEDLISRKIETGLIGNRYTEISLGLDSGDVVINSHALPRLKNNLTNEKLTK